MRRWLVVAVIVAALIAVGLSRLELDADVFGLLPRDEPTVEGLKLYQETFGSAQELMLTVRSPDADLTEEAARSLAEALQASDLTRRALWRDPFRDDPEALSELLGYLWFNQPANEFSRLAERFEDDRLVPILDETIELMTTSLRGEDIGRLSHDPYGLTYLPGNIESPISRGLEDPFSSADGRFRILFVTFPYEDAGYFTCHHWTNAIEDLIASWRDDAGYGDELVIKMTGDPAFIAEIGAGLLRDMKLAALGTLILVASLFWFVHRSWLPLAWLVALLVTVLLGTVAIGSLVLGALNVVALGFAAILLGLAADYALILYQEYISEPGRSVADLRKAIAPSILWAAGTTAGAFFMVGRSSLPGLTQLGTLVAVGILLAALVMLAAFLPPLARFGSGRLDVGVERFPASTSRVRTAWWITFALVAVSSLILMWRLPAVDTSTDELGPKNAAARQALDEVHVEVGGFAEALWLLVSGADEAEVSERLERAEKLIDEAVASGMLKGSALPTALWPRPRLQDANRAQARELGLRFDAARDAAVAAGFTDESLRLTKGIFSAWTEFAASDDVAMPRRPASEWAFRKFSARDGDRLLVVGRVDRRLSVPVAELETLAASIEAEGSQLLGWPFISGALLETMNRDLRRVLLPMIAVILVLLGCAFRGIREVALSLLTLLVSLLCLSSVMVVLGWEWNLMNVMALPLLFGAAVDYGIHVQLALQRYDGDLRKVRETVGRAILLCGASTAAGFGTLGFASNGGLATLGRICATGIVIAALISVFLLPVWWRAAVLRSRDGGRS